MKENIILEKSHLRVKNCIHFKDSIYRKYKKSLISLIYLTGWKFATTLQVSALTGKDI